MKDTFTVGSYSETLSILPNPSAGIGPIEILSLVGNILKIYDKKGNLKTKMEDFFSSKILFSKVHFLERFYILAINENTIYVAESKGETISSKDDFIIHTFPGSYELERVNIGVNTKNIMFCLKNSTYLIDKFNFAIRFISSSSYIPVNNSDENLFITINEKINLISESGKTIYDIEYRKPKKQKQLGSPAYLDVSEEISNVYYHNSEIVGVYSSCERENCAKIFRIKSNVLKTYTFEDSSIICPSVAISGQGYLYCGGTMVSENMYPSIAVARICDKKTQIDHIKGNSPFDLYRCFLKEDTVNWGIYSSTYIDTDNMSAWTLQTMSINNEWVTKMCKLYAPPLFVDSYTYEKGTIIIKGRGFYDSGNKLKSVMGDHILDTVYDSSTKITLKPNWYNVEPGIYDLSITNPDGQYVSLENFIDIKEGEISVKPKSQSISVGLWTFYTITVDDPKSEFYIYNLPEGVTHNFSPITNNTSFLMLSSSDKVIPKQYDIDVLVVGNLSVNRTTIKLSISSPTISSLEIESDVEKVYMKSGGIKSFKLNIKGSEKVDITFGGSSKINAYYKKGYVVLSNNTEPGLYILKIKVESGEMKKKLKVKVIVT